MDASGKITAGELTITAGKSKTPLTEGMDFTVSYSNNVNTGKAKVIITGIGENIGTVAKFFKIKPATAVSIDAELANPSETITYSPRGTAPEISVTAQSESGTTDLVFGIDYLVTYSSNKKVGSGKYTVKFRGNYKGHAAVKGKFRIEKASLDDAVEVKVEAAQMLYKKPGKYLSKPFVTVDGVRLRKSDYTVG